MVKKTPFFFLLVLFLIPAIQAHAGCVTRYFVVQPDDTSGYNTIVMPDGDLLPLASLTSRVVATLSDGRKIIHAILPPSILEDLAKLAECEDPLSLECVGALGITHVYAGRDLAEVLTMFQELAGQVLVGVDEQGQPVMIDKILRHKWACE